MSDKFLHFQFDLTQPQWHNSLPGLRLPDRRLPKRFLVKEDKFICFGYASGFQGKLDGKVISEYCSQNKWQELARKIGHFLVIYIDLQDRKIQLLSDMFASFTCFLTIQKGVLTVSNDFGLVLKSLNEKKINQNGLLDMMTIFDVTSPTNETIVEDIFQLPPVTLLTITDKGKYGFEPLAELDRFSYPVESYRTASNFTEELLEVGEKVVRDWVSSTGTDKVAVELSSCFDCSLVAYLLSKIKGLDLTCYSRTSNVSPEDTVIPVMMDFAKLHNLRVKLFPADQFFPLSHHHELEWIRQHLYPFNQGQEMGYQLAQFILKDGCRVKFTGVGGDELYYSNDWSNFAMFPVQIDYFDLVNILGWDIDRIFTPQWLNKISDRRRFEHRQPFLAYASSSAINYCQHYSVIMWQAELMELSPLMDPRLLQVARKIPVNDDGQPIDRQEVWKDREDVFPKSYFRTKVHFQNHINQYLTKRSDLIIQILEHSILGQLGVIKSDEIIENLKAGRIGLYTEKPANILIKVLYIDYFLQHHNILY